MLTDIMNEDIDSGHLDIVDSYCYQLLIIHLIHLYIPRNLVPLILFGLSSHVSLITAFYVSLVYSHGSLEILILILQCMNEILCEIYMPSWCCLLSPS